MKKFLTTVLSVCLMAFFSLSFAQNDKVYLHNGEVMEVSVKGISSGIITYSYPGEALTQEVAEKQVEKIVFSSGRVQQVSEKIVINGKDDWEKVAITSLESDIKGLVRKGEVKGSKTGATTFSSTSKVLEKAEKEMKEEAAEMGAHIIFIKNYQVRDSDGINSMTGLAGGRSAKASVTGIAYGYE